MTRDSQLKKMWSVRAGMLTAFRPDLSVSEAGRIHSTVRGSAWFRRRFVRNMPQACWIYQHPDEWDHRIDIAHALAHSCVDYNNPGEDGLGVQLHGPQFTKMWVEMYVHLTDADHGLKLREFLKEYRMKARVVSVATRSKQRENFVDRQLVEAHDKMLATLARLNTTNP